VVLDCVRSGLARKDGEEEDEKEDEDDQTRHDFSRASKDLHVLTLLTPLRPIPRSHPRFTSAQHAQGMASIIFVRLDNRGDFQDSVADGA